LQPEIDLHSSLQQKNHKKSFKSIDLVGIRDMVLLFLRNDIMQESIEHSHGQQQETALPEWMELVRRQVNSLKFGSVLITVHDSRVTQVEKVEKVRLDKPYPGLAR
jgi:hypothetical protein